MRYRIFLTLLFLVLYSWVMVLSACRSTETRQIAFFSTLEPYGTGKSDIHVVNADGSAQKQLTITGDNRYPTWSPSGQHISFVSVRTGGSEIYVMVNDGSRQTRLTNVSNVAMDWAFPTWSPDGQEIAFEYFEGYGTIYTVSADGKRIRKITSGFDARTPRWSPSGNKIAFWYLREHRAPSQVAVINVNGNDWQLLADGANQVWSPDGRKIAFVSDNEIHVINANGSDLTRLTQIGVAVLAFSHPTWSPDGQRIAFVSGRDGSGLIRLTDNPANDDSPAWSPDGKQIAFVSDRDGNREIYVMNADGSNPKRLTNSQATNGILLGHPSRIRFPNLFGQFGHPPERCQVWRAQHRESECLCAAWFAVVA
ncbi:MAG: PD40 domain-containing protein [Chloroflexi bacterium]|nr:PD40 domain-containing protein [Chloroflexota bacterium]